jgi:protein TonB
MLDRLIESGGDRKQSRSLRLFFLGTATLVLTGCFSVFVWSIMAMEPVLTEDGLELSTLVAPVSIPAAEPPKPEPVQEQQQQQPAKSEMASRQSLMERVEDSKTIPDTVSVTPNTQRALPKSGAVKVSPGPETDGIYSTTPGRGAGGDPNLAVKPGAVARKIDDVDEAPLMEKKPAEVKKPVTIVHSSVINGKATSLPKPFYPPSAISINAAGEVNVQVTLDEAGNVISAKAVSGHILLRQSAEQAARNAKFSPTILNGQRVKVTGLIVYRFSRNG